MKKVLSILLACVLVVGLAACGGGSGSVKYTVGVCQLVAHDALDKATKGFVEELKKEFGDDIEIVVENAGGEQSSCTTIVNDFISRNVDLIMCNATPALQAAAAATDTVPILGTSVTHYAPALDIDNWTGTVGGNISGTSDLADLSQQSVMIKEWFPDCKKVAILYCSSEINSVYQSLEVQKYLTELGIESKEFSFTDTNDVASVTMAACQYADVIYVPTDNVAASNTEAISNVVLEQKTPIIAGEWGICTGCGVATAAIDYYDLGVATARMAAKILRGEAKVSEMPIEYAPEIKKYYNPDVCELLGVTPLEGYEVIK